MGFRHLYKSSEFSCDTALFLLVKIQYILWPVVTLCVYNAHVMNPFISSTIFVLFFSFFKCKFKV